MISGHCTHIVEYISPAEMLLLVIFDCNYRVGLHIAAATWPYTHLLALSGSFIYCILFTILFY